jgi:hypothetical protein
MSKGKWISAGVAAFAIIVAATLGRGEPSGSREDLLDCSRIAALGYAACPLGLAREGGAVIGAATRCQIERERTATARTELERVIRTVPGHPERREVVLRVADVRFFAVRFADLDGRERVRCQRAVPRFEALETSLRQH